MLRVLQVVTYMGCGGLETMLMNYYRNIDRTKVQFDFLVHRDFDAYYDSEIKQLGGKIYHLPRLNPFSGNYFNKLNDFFSRHKEYKIVHSHLDCMAGIPLKYAEKNGVPVRIAHAHNSGQDKNLKYILKLFYKRNIRKYATDLFACSEDAGEWMFGDEKFKVLNNAIFAKNYIFDSDKRIKTRLALNLDDCFTVGLIGRFSPQKNHFYLLEIFNFIVRIEPTAKLILVGDGDLRSDIEKRIEKLGLNGNVIMTGIRKDIPELLCAMDAFVMPSNYEGFGIASLEAQASGLRCFISDKVPIECKRTDLVEQIPLSSSPEYWAERILSAKGAERNNTYKDIVNAGFDIESSAHILEEFYLEKARV